jgi:membrane protein YqaA with SNARE-associated domain
VRAFLSQFVSSIYTLALGLGGPGLFIAAFLDSSFISLPQINDLLVVWMVTRNKSAMPYYAGLATLGSVAGCYVIYLLAEKGGEAFLRKRLKAGHLERALNTYKRHGLMALIVPGLLPPPAPFKLFVLAAGLADVKPARFLAGVAISRGARYFIIGLLSIYYGDAAIVLVRTHGPEVALGLVGVILLAAAGFWLFRRRAGRARAV